MLGLSFSLIFSVCEEIGMHKVFHLICSSISQDGGLALRPYRLKKEPKSSPKPDKAKCLKNCRPLKIVLENAVSFRDPVLLKENVSSETSNENGNECSKFIPRASLLEPVMMIFSPEKVSELDDAAVKVQKAYKSYQTRRNLADCAVVVEELWWKALDFAALRRSSVSFFNVEKPETAVSRWARARTRAAKVGKGLSKDDNAQKLALQHWLEAIDPRHRYGHNLHLYYDVWFGSASSQPFFFWLDVGDGKELNLDSCPRTKLQHQCIKYLGPALLFQKERQAYEVIVENGKLVYRESSFPVETSEGSKWIFVLSTAKTLYVGQKEKGLFQHSSFLAGAATTAAGRLVARDGVLEAVWPYSGHYRPTEENFQEFISFLEEHHVDLTNVMRHAIDDDRPSFCTVDVQSRPMPMVDRGASTELECSVPKNRDPKAASAKPPVLKAANGISCRWSTGAGPRITCVRDYPTDLQWQALEQVNLSPRVTPGIHGPIPSPRPSPTVWLSPRLACMGLRNPIPTAAC